MLLSDLSISGVKIVTSEWCAALGSSIKGSGDIVFITSRGFANRGELKKLDSLGLGSRLQVIDSICPNPNTEAIQKLIDLVRRTAPSTIVALGGGSVIDTAKCLWLAMSLSKFSVPDLLNASEDLCCVNNIDLITVPTTCGTGAEVTPFATVWDKNADKKYSVSHTDMRSDCVILDPTLLQGCPHEILLHSMLDSLSHGFESYWNINSNKDLALLSVNSLRVSIECLRQHSIGSNSPEMLASMQKASLLAGYVISHTQTAIAHSMSYPMTMTLGIPHGLACSFTLPAILEFNSVLNPDHFQQFACMLGYPTTEALTDIVIKLLNNLNVKSRVLSYAPEGANSFKDIYCQMIHPERAKNNLRPVGELDARLLVERTFEMLS